MQLIVGIYKAVLYREFTQQWHLYWGDRYVSFNLPFKIHLLEGDKWFRYANGSRWWSGWRSWRDEELDGW